MLTGHELGLPLTSAFDVIYVSKNGRRTLRPKGALALVHRSGLLEEFSWESNDSEATVTMKRKGGQPHSMTLTIEQARRAGWKSTAWETTPANLLRWRLVGWLCDLLFADALCGLSIADDSYLPVEITEDGDVIDATGGWKVEPVTQSPPQPAKTKVQSESAKVPEPKAPEAVKEPEPTKESEPVKEPELVEIPDNLTVANILERGYTAADVMEAAKTLQAEGKEVHAIPYNPIECKLVLERLQTNGQ
jgi:hypothetical protein